MFLVLLRKIDQNMYIFLIEYPVSLVNAICQLRLECFVLTLRVRRSVGQTRSLALSDNWHMFCQRETEEEIGRGKRESRER